MNEKRRHTRYPGQNRAAVIYATREAEPMMCTVKDISEGGAGLTVINTRGLPDQFELEIKGEDIRRVCRVAWKKDPHDIGVEFIGEAPLPPET